MLYAVYGVFGIVVVYLSVVCRLWVTEVAYRKWRI